MIVSDLGCAIRVAFVYGFLRGLLVKTRLHLGRRDAGGVHQALARILPHRVCHLAHGRHHIVVHAELR